LDEDGKALLAFVKRLTRLRLTYPVLRRSRFLVGDYNEAIGVKDVTWLAPDGNEMSVEQWEDPHGRCMGMLIDGRAQVSGIARPGSEATMLLIVNAHHDVVPFKLPAVPEGDYWSCLIDTDRPELRKPEQLAFDSTFDVTGRSFLLLVLKHQED
ncbi:MAG: glycogen debranching enzyme GlgX, partial [Pseudomonas sp.]